MFVMHFYVFSVSIAERRLPLMPHMTAMSEERMLETDCARAQSVENPTPNRLN